MRSATRPASKQAPRPNSGTLTTPTAEASQRRGPSRARSEVLEDLVGQRLPGDEASIRVPLADVRRELHELATLERACRVRPIETEA
jgi:hypothetical protein